MLEKLTGARARFEEQLKNIKDLNDLDALRVAFCGKKGELTEISKMMGSLNPEERPVMGQKVNELRTLIEG